MSKSAKFRQSHCSKAGISAAIATTSFYHHITNNNIVNWCLSVHNKSVWQHFSLWLINADCVLCLLQWYNFLFHIHLLSSLQHADLAPTKLQLQMPTAPNAPLTAPPHRNKPQSAFVRKVSTVLRTTLAQWLAHVSDSNTVRKFKPSQSQYSLQFTIVKLLLGYEII